MVLGLSRSRPELTCKRDNSVGRDKNQSTTLRRSQCLQELRVGKALSLCKPCFARLFRRPRGIAMDVIDNVTWKSALGKAEVLLI